MPREATGRGSFSTDSGSGGGNGGGGAAAAVVSSPSLNSKTASKLKHLLQSVIKSAGNSKLKLSTRCVVVVVVVDVAWLPKVTRTHTCILHLENDVILKPCVAAESCALPINTLTHESNATLSVQSHHSSVQVQRR